MKTHDVPERRLRRIAEEIEAAIDCTVCANCCRVATVVIQERDAERLGRFLGISRARFLETYTMESEAEGIILKRDDSSGCVFLEGNSCTVYEARPAACQDFPHLVRGAGSIASRMWQFIDRATYCPIVYNSLEAFKPVLRFRR
jgi:hypothetical protein